MKTLSRFVAKFTKLIVAVLSCFDRVVFKGYLPFTNGPALEGFVDHVLGIRRCDFMAFAEEQSEALVEHAQQMARDAGAEYVYLQGAHRKDKLVDQILRRRPISEGLICVLCCMECRPSFRLASGEDRPRLVNARRQQRVLYSYSLDPALGLIHIRLTTWFPFTRAPAYRQVEWLTEPVVVSGRSHAGFNPASGADAKLFGAVLGGNNLVRGFRNADIREALYGPTEDAGERRRRSQAVGRMLKRLHVRGLIAKVPRSRRWHVGQEGHQVLGAVVRLDHHGIPKAVDHAA